MSYVVADWVRHHSTAKGAAWEVLMILAAYAGDDGSNAFPSRQRIALESNRSEKAVRVALASLQADGWIEPRGWSPYKTQAWQIVMDPSVPTKRLRWEQKLIDKGVDPGTVGTPGTSGTPGNQASPRGPEVRTPGTSGTDPGDLRSPELLVEQSVEPSSSSRAHEDAEYVEAQLRGLCVIDDPDFGAHVAEVLNRHPGKNVRHTVGQLVGKYSGPSADPIGRPLALLDAFLAEAVDHDELIRRQTEKAAADQRDLDRLNEARMRDWSERYPPQPGDPDYVEEMIA